MATIVGVFREAQFSPGRVEDDAAILRATAAVLEKRGLSLRLGDVERAAAPDVAAVLAMCQTADALRALDVHARRVPVINTPTAIRNCYRTETVRLLSAAGGPFPRTAIVSTAAPPPDTGPCWVKRGDVHAMAAGDVRFAPDRVALAAALADLAARSIEHATVQAHVDGAAVKFYGIADGRFFRCYVDGEEAPAPLPALWGAARAAACTLGLEVFGGDLIVDRDGVPMVVDVNDWPSFARCRAEAAEAIAGYVYDRVRAHAADRHTSAAVRAGTDA
jgi:hypothetical protein